MYSLVSPSVLCTDLVRHENGIGLIDILDRTLMLTAEDMPALTSVHHPDPAREAAWAEVDRVTGATPRLSDAVAVVRERIADGGLEALAGAGLAERLSRTPMFGLAHLLAMVRHDVLDWTWQSAGEVAVQQHPEAIDVICDAVAGAYTRAQLSVAAYARLGGPWSLLHRERPLALPADDAFGPQSRVLRELVERAARLTAAELARVEQAGAHRADAVSTWPSLMHNASWAAYLSGRLRPATRAHLAAARALLLTGLEPMQAATGVMRVVSAAVAALVVADVLDTETYDALLAPWNEALGAL